jgi:Fic family protein
MTILPFQTAELASLIEEIDAWKKRLDHGRTLARSWMGRLRRDLEAEAIAASTSMEGVAVTVDEVRRILAGDRPPKVREEDRLLVEGYRDAMSFVLRRADDPAFRWDRELIVALHDRVLAGRLSDGAGRLRTGPAWVVRRDTGEQVFEPPPHEEVPNLIDAACAQMEKGFGHAALNSAWIHVAIAAIHPFKDGNGRCSRVLASLAMYRGGYTRPEFTSLEEWWGRHLPEYYAAFECLGSRFSAEADVTPFLREHLQAQLHQIRALDLREQVQEQIWTVLEEVAQDRRLPERTAHALWDAFFGRDVTAGYYRGLADVSAPTATKDLTGAVLARLLEPLGERKGRRYRPTLDLYKEAAAALGVDSIPDDPDGARNRIISVLSERLTYTGEALGFKGPPFDTGKS